MNGNFTHVNELSSTWQRRADLHHQNQLLNPFSEIGGTGTAHRQVRSIHDPEYGRPVANSKTHKRGKDAAKLVQKEIERVIETIEDMSCDWPNGMRGVRFGDLFTRYNTISNKLVGTLIRARRQGFVDFEGEMLWQNRDDDVIVSVITKPTPASLENTNSTNGGGGVGGGGFTADLKYHHQNRLHVDSHHHGLLSDSGSEVGSDVASDFGSDLGPSFTSDNGSDLGSHFVSDIASDLGSIVESDLDYESNVGGISDIGSDICSNIASDVGSDVG